MSDPERGEESMDERRERWQFGLIHLLLAPVWLALALGFYIWQYPYSAVVLWLLGPVFLLFLIVIAVVSIAVGGCPWPVLRNTLIAGLLLYILGSILGPGCIDPREYSRRSWCSNNMKQVLIGVHNYHDQYRSFPLAYVPDEAGRPMHSWRTLILPYIDQHKLYSQYRMDEPWNGPNNSKLAGTSVDQYVCPEQRALGKQTMTSYVAVSGPGMPWSGPTPRRFEDLSNGTSNTLMVVEMAESGIHWMEPRDLDVATMAQTVNAPAGQGVSSLHCDPGWWRERLGAHVGFADGSVRFLPTSHSLRELLGLGAGADVGPAAAQGEHPSGQVDDGKDAGGDE